MTTTERNARRTMTGTVISAKAAKTITVEIQRTFKHPKYGKYVRRRKRYLAHDEDRTAGYGDVVEIQATRPISKNKTWRLVRVLTRSQLGEAGSKETPNQVLEDLGATPGGDQ